MSHRGFVAAAVAALALAPLVALAQPTPDMTGKKGTMHLSETTQVAGTLLEPGYYQFQHEYANGHHYLRVHARATEGSLPGRGSDWRFAGRVTGEVARVPCMLVAADPKTQTALSLRRDPNSLPTITRVQIEGERGAHLLVVAGGPR